MEATKEAILKQLKEDLQTRASQILGADPQWAYIKGKIEGMEIEDEKKQTPGGKK